MDAILLYKGADYLAYDVTWDERRKAWFTSKYVNMSLSYPNAYMKFVRGPTYFINVDDCIVMV